MVDWNVVLPSDFLNCLDEIFDKTPKENFWFLCDFSNKIILPRDQYSFIQIDDQAFDKETAVISESDTGKLVLNMGAVLFDLDFDCLSDFGQNTMCDTEI